MNQAAYLVLNYAARYWFAVLAAFIVYRAAVATLREYRIVRGIRRRIEEVATFAELKLVSDPSGVLPEGASYSFAREAQLGSGSGCDIRLRAKGIARRHARLLVDADCVRVIPARGKQIILEGAAVKGEGLVFDGGEISVAGLAFRVKIGEAFHAEK